VTPTLQLSTVVNHLVALTHFYDFCVDVAALKLRNPARIVLGETKKMKDKAPPRPKRRAPEFEQFVDILESCPSLRDLAGFAVAASTLVRNGEFRYVKDTDVYIDERWLRLTPIPGGKRVRPVWDRRDAPKPIDDSFWVPLTKEAAWIAGRWIDEKRDHPYFRHSSYFFAPPARKGREDKPIGSWALNDAFQAAVKRSDVPVDWADPVDRLVFHSTRHIGTDALEAATRGADGESRFKDMIDLLRGDSDKAKRSANTYTHVKPAALQAFVDEFSPGFGVKRILAGIVARERETTSIHGLVRGTSGFARTGSS
jgi:integrase